MSSPPLSTLLSQVLTIDIKHSFFVKYVAQDEAIKVGYFAFGQASIFLIEQDEFMDTKCIPIPYNEILKVCQDNEKPGLISIWVGLKKTTVYKVAVTSVPDVLEKLSACWELAKLSQTNKVPPPRPFRSLLPVPISWILQSSHFLSKGAISRHVYRFCPRFVVPHLLPGFL